MAEASTNNQNYQHDQKSQKKWFTIPESFRYKLIIVLLLFLLIGVIGGGGYLGYVGYKRLGDKDNEIQNLRKELDKLNSERDLGIVDLQKKLDEKNAKVAELENKVNSLKTELNAAQAKIEELSPKDIRNVDYKKLIKNNELNGDVWLNPSYFDVNGDGRLDAIFAYRAGGPGEFLHVYVYSYLNNNNLTQVLKAEGYLYGRYTYKTDENVLEITSQAGTPDDPKIAVSRFKWDPAQSKMMKVQ
jgi:cell division protein FtsB